MVVLQFDDKETLQSIEKFDDLVLYEQKKNGYGSAPAIYLDTRFSTPSTAG